MWGEGAEAPPAPPPLRALVGRVLMNRRGDLKRVIKARRYNIMC